MATRARIGLELRNGSILSVYHHWDGYPEWLGRILKTHYNNRVAATALIDGGDMSVAWNDNNEPEYYGTDCPPRFDADLAEYLDKNNSGEEYAYVFRAGKWVCYNMHEFDEQLPEVVEIPSRALAC